MPVKAENPQETLKPVESISSDQWIMRIELTHFTESTTVTDWNAITCQPTIKWVALINDCEEIGVICFTPQQKIPFGIQDSNTEFFFSLAKTVDQPIGIPDMPSLLEAMQARRWEKPEQFDAVFSIMQKLQQGDVTEEVVAGVFGEIAKLPGLEDERKENAEMCKGWGPSHDHSKLV